LKDAQPFERIYAVKQLLFKINSREGALEPQGLVQALERTLALQEVVVRMTG
jgi:hypothetical protein